MQKGSGNNGGGGNPLRFMIKCGTERGRENKLPPGHDSSGLPPISPQCSERSPRRVSGGKYPGITHTHTRTHTLA